MGRGDGKGSLEGGMGREREMREWNGGGREGLVRKGTGREETGKEGTRRMGTGRGDREEEAEESGNGVWEGR